MKSLWQSREQAEDTAERLRKFGQPLRLMILSLLLQGEKSVSEIDMATGIGQPGLSQQLAELRRAELVTTRRQAKQVFYSIADESVELCVRGIEAIFGAGDPRVALHLGMKQPDGRPRSDGVAGAANFVRIR
jgi:DNA-binding transcriptional ArsR family regulator